MAAARVRGHARCCGEAPELAGGDLVLLVGAEAGCVGCGAVRVEDEEGFVQGWGGTSAMLLLWACTESWAHLQNRTA